MNADKTCVATFDLVAQRRLEVFLQTEAIDDSVNINPPDVNCDYTGSGCVQVYNQGTQVTLTAQPGSNSRFLKWSGDCTGTEPVIQVTMDVDKTCTANFAPIQSPNAVLTCQNQTDLGGFGGTPPGCIGINLDTYRFDGSQSSDLDGSIVQYEFDFTCNGSYDYTETSGNAPDGTFDGMTTHIYSGAFNGSACLRVTDNDGLTSMDEVPMDVREVRVDVSPPTANVILSGTQQFTASVENAANQGVTWSVISGAGSIDSNGLYTAPDTLPPDPTVIIQTCSVVDPSKCDTAVITLVSSVIGCTAPVVNLTSPQQIPGVMEQNTTGGPFDAHTTGMANDAAGFVYIATGYISEPLANNRTDSQWVTKIDLNPIQGGGDAIVTRLNLSAINPSCAAGSDHCLSGLVVLPNGDIVVAGLDENFNSILYRVTNPGGEVSVFPSDWTDGTFIYSGFGGGQTDLALDGQGNVWVAASGYHADQFAQTLQRAARMTRPR